MGREFFGSGAEGTVDRDHIWTLKRAIKRVIDIKQATLESTKNGDQKNWSSA